MLLFISLRYYRIAKINRNSFVFFYTEENAWQSLYNTASYTQAAIRNWLNLYNAKFIWEMQVVCEILIVPLSSVTPAVIHGFKKKINYALWSNILLYCTRRRWKMKHFAVKK